MLRSVCAAAGAAGARALRRTALPASSFGGSMSLGRAFHTSPVALDRILVGASSSFKNCDDDVRAVMAPPAWCAPHDPVVTHPRPAPIPQSWFILAVAHSLPYDVPVGVMVKPCLCVSTVVLATPCFCPCPTAPRFWPSASGRRGPSLRPDPEGRWAHGG